MSSAPISIEIAIGIAVILTGVVVCAVRLLYKKGRRRKDLERDIIETEPKLHKKTAADHLEEIKEATHKILEPLKIISPKTSFESSSLLKERTSKITSSKTSLESSSKSKSSSNSKRNSRSFNKRVKSRSSKNRSRYASNAGSKVNSRTGSKPSSKSSSKPRSLNSLIIDSQIKIPPPPPPPSPLKPHSDNIETDSIQASLLNTLLSEPSSQSSSVNPSSSEELSQVSSRVQPRHMKSRVHSRTLIHSKQIPPSPPGASSHISSELPFS